MEGELTKLKIIPCILSGPADQQTVEEDKSIEAYSVLVNPESYSTVHEVSLNYSEAQGVSGMNPRFNRIMPQTMNFEFIFDGTGILQANSGFLSNIPLVGPFASSATTTITEQIEKFKSIVLVYHGDSHEPRYVKLIWGTLLFVGRLTYLSINYKLFKPDGTPIRATANCSFTGAIEESLRAAQENRQSADITHVRTVKEGDQLPRLTFDVYGDSSYYLEVARVNQLTNFRKLVPGFQLRFPPLEKST